MSKKVVLTSALVLGLVMSMGQVVNAADAKKGTCAQQATHAGIKDKKQRADFIKKCKTEQKKAKKEAQKMKKEKVKEKVQEKKAK